eukprot:COSAG02_NODE_73_length_41919_cov_6.571066_17_plen_169_part_00
MYRRTCVHIARYPGVQAYNEAARMMSPSKARKTSPQMATLLVTAVAALSSATASAAPTHKQQAHVLLTGYLPWANFTVNPAGTELQQALHLRPDGIATEGGPLPCTQPSLSVCSGTLRLCCPEHMGVTSKAPVAVYNHSTAFMVWLPCSVGPSLSAQCDFLRYLWNCR